MQYRLPANMGDTGKIRQRAVQNRTMVTRGKIADGAVDVLARAGVQGLTHRAVARAAGVSLAATTYHFDTKSDIVEEASRTLLDGYLAAFRRLADRIAAAEETRFTNLNDLIERIVLNVLGRERMRSLAWSELILHGGRSPSGRTLAQSWYEQLDAIWQGIARLIEPGAPRNKASAAIDLTVGLTFVLHPLGLDQKMVADILAGRRDPEPLLEKVARARGAHKVEVEEDELPTRYADMRRKIVEVAIDIMVREGAAGISHRRVAEVAGMVRSGPSYYFATIEELLETAQMALFERAKARYRAGLGSAGTASMDKERLLDLTTAIFFREALEFGSESIGHYSVWIGAAQNPSLRPAVASSLLDQHRAWMRRLASVSGKVPNAAVALRMQALFIGKLIRAIAAAVPVDDLAGAREDFALVLDSGPKSPEL
jgi:DNA-binding transcriptional regulator YbjK